MSEINLMFQDSRDFVKTIPDNHYDWIIADPLYGINETSHRKNLSRTKLAKVKAYDSGVFTDVSLIPTAEDLEKWFRISKNQIIWGANYLVSEVPDFTFPSSGRIVWDKVNRKSNFSDCEIAFQSKSHTTRMFSFMWNGMLQGKDLHNGRTAQGNKKLNQSRIHPTEKPVSLYNWIYLNFLKKKLKVFDPGFGSGSIGLSALRCGYDLDACEINKTYYNDAIERFSRIKEEEEKIPKLFTQLEIPIS